jgi:citrate synthase
LPQHANPMDVLRTAVSALSLYDPDRDAGASDGAANLRKAYRLTGQVAAIVAATDRIRKGRDPVAPDASLGHAANFVHMLTGRRPSATAEKAFDVALILHADHELNASTFAGRVTAATLSDVHSAVTSAIGALKGPLHGGANIDVMHMLLEIGEPSKVEAYLRNSLASKKKISGFGHRVYRTEDPRATHLRRMSRELCESSGNAKWFEMSRMIEETMKREKNINANVDFYSATVYYALGVAVDLFTPIFAVSRISGWTAHILEQLGNNRLIRPRAEYTGPEYPAPYLSMAQR